MYDPEECRQRLMVGESVLCEDLAGGDGSMAVVIPGLTEKRLAKLLGWIDKDAPGGCWLWRGYFSGANHCPVFNVGGKNQSARRLVWLLEGGRELDRREVLVYMCGNGECVNPAHMVIGPLGRRWERRGGFPLSRE